MDAKFQLSADALPADNSALSDRVRDREVDAVLGLKGDTGATCWHGLTVAEMRNRLDTSTENGLDAAEAQIRLRKFGPNRLPAGKKSGPLKRFLSQLNNILVYVLVFYLLNSRYLIDSSLSLHAHVSNKYLPVGIGAVALLQILFTYAPPLQRIFNTEAIPARAWPWLLLGGLMFFLLVETEKLIIRSSKLLRRTVTAAEAGT